MGGVTKKASRGDGSADAESVGDEDQPHRSPRGLEPDRRTLHAAALCERGKCAPGRGSPHMRVCPVGRCAHRTCSCLRADPPRLTGQPAPAPGPRPRGTPSEETKRAGRCHPARPCRVEPREGAPHLLPARARLCPTLRGFLALLPLEAPRTPGNLISSSPRCLSWFPEAVGYGWRDFVPRSRCCDARLGQLSRLWSDPSSRRSTDP